MSLIRKLRQTTFPRHCQAVWGRDDTYRTQEHLHIDLGGRVNTVQLARAVAMDNVHQSIDGRFNVS